MELKSAESLIVKSFRLKTTSPDESDDSPSDNLSLLETRITLLELGHGRADLKRPQFRFCKPCFEAGPAENIRSSK
jgi:hypothetical protein